MSRNTPRRRIPWTSAGLASAGLHLLALLALGTITGRLTPIRPGGPELSGAAIAIELTRLPAQPDSSVSRPRPAPVPGRVAATAIARMEASPAGAPTNSAPGAVDADELYRAPFRDAVRQAYASLRGGLGCRHVDLSSLPGPMRVLCDTAARLKGAEDLAELGGDPPAPAGIDARWRFQPSAEPGPVCTAATAEARDAPARGPTLRVCRG